MPQFQILMNACGHANACVPTRSKPTASSAADKSREVMNWSFAGIGRRANHRSTRHMTDSVRSARHSGLGVVRYRTPAGRSTRLISRNSDCLSITCSSTSTRIARSNDAFGERQCSPIVRIERAPIELERRGLADGFARYVDTGHVNILRAIGVPGFEQHLDRTAVAADVDHVAYRRVGHEVRGALVLAPRAEAAHGIAIGEETPPMQRFLIEVCLDAFGGHNDHCRAS